MPTTLPRDPNTVGFRVAYWAARLSTCRAVADQVNSEDLPRRRVELSPERVDAYISTYMQTNPELGLSPLPLYGRDRSGHSGAGERERQKQRDEGQDHRRDAPSGRMSSADALDYLGLKPGATKGDIQAAYKRLQMRCHPDVGGSEGLSKQLNAARDVLLG